MTAAIATLALQQLRLEDFRNVAHADLRLSPGANIIVGANGSGKTSVLEAVYMLATARSFRAGRATSVIRFGTGETRLFGKFRIGERSHRVGLSRARTGDLGARVNGQPVQQASELATEIPVVLITPESLDLVSGSPELRRRCLDWGVFHVEPSVTSAWSRFRRALRQRNELLRRDADSSQFRPWNAELAESGRMISLARERYLAQLLGIDALREVMEALEASIELSLGWSGEDLLTLLQQNEARDRALGHTSAGPHRADLRIRTQGRAASEVMSRGQKKRLSIELRLGQMAVLSERSERRAIALVDDLRSELDASATRAVLDRLADMGVQRFLTTLDEPERVRVREDDAVFHVEHGRISGPLLERTVGED